MILQNVLWKMSLFTRSNINQNQQRNDNHTNIFFIPMSIIANKFSVISDNDEEDDDFEDGNQSELCYNIKLYYIKKLFCY